MARGSSERSPVSEGEGLVAGGPRPASRDLSTLRALIRYLAPYKLVMAAGALALLLSATTILGMGMGARILVDDVLAEGDPALLDQAAFVAIGLVVLLAASSFTRLMLVSYLGERVVADMRRDVYGHVLSLSPAFFEMTSSAEVQSRLTTDTTLLQTVVGGSVATALRHIVTLAGAVIMLIITSPYLTMIVLLVVPVVVGPILWFGRRVRGLSRESQDRVADVGIHVGESLNAIQVVQAFTHEAEDRRLFDGRVAAALATAVRRIRQRATLTAMVISMVFGAVAVILWVGGRSAMEGGISWGDLVLFIFASVLVAGAVANLSEIASELFRAAGAMERLLELQATEPDIKAPGHPVALPPRQSGVGGRIRLDAVGFRYPTRPDHWALDGLSLEVAPGETVAVVGPSGAGKSTVFQLLLRFYDPDRGVVSLDGVDLREADPKDARARMALVPQEPVIFSTNVHENIRFGRPDATREEIVAAAEAAAIRDFVDSLPDGFESHLGERGVRLSGGQRQRIAIARAVLRNPSLLLLDEATSALDAESERAVQRALGRLMHGRTTLVIAHRLATVRRADRIAVLEQGRLVAMGSHDSLMAQGGLYAHLASLQFADAEALASTSIATLRNAMF